MTASQLNKRKEFNNLSHTVQQIQNIDNLRESVILGSGKRAHQGRGGKHTSEKERVASAAIPVADIRIPYVGALYLFLVPSTFGKIPFSAIPATCV